MASGSEQRLRQTALKVRLTADERAILVAAAERAGLTLAGYARARLLAAPPLRQARRPPVERVLLAQLLGRVGTLGAAVHQLAGRLNADGPNTAPAFIGAAGDIAAMRAAIMVALGREPGDQVGRDELVDEAVP